LALVQLSENYYPRAWLEYLSAVRLLGPFATTQLLKALFPGDLACLRKGIIFNILERSGIFVVAMLEIGSASRLGRLC
jgi:hypothetical protein